MALLALKQRGSMRLRAAVGLPDPVLDRYDTQWHFPMNGAPAIADVTEESELEGALIKYGVSDARYFAGVPLAATNGQELGMLAVVDRIPRTLASRRIEILNMLAGQMVAQLELGRRMYQEGKLRAEEQTRLLLQDGDDHERKIARLQAVIESQRTVDELTGVKNERAFRDRLLEEFERYERLQQPFSLIMCEVERMENYVSLFGAGAVNDLLKRMAEMALLRTRYCDIVARYGDYRFGIILPGTGAREAHEVVDKLRRVAGVELPNLQGHKINVGVATVPGSARSSQALIEECLRRLRTGEATEP
jgi:diguanylate cyclase (GGDEF)-like protein